MQPPVVFTASCVNGSDESYIAQCELALHLAKDGTYTYTATGKGRYGYVHCHGQTVRVGVTHQVRNLSGSVGSMGLQFSQFGSP